MKKQFLLTGALLLSAAMSFGAGYQLNLQGLRQLAMGGSGAAIPWDAATIYYNPGGLSEFKHLTAYASGQFIMPHVSYVQTPTGVGTTNTNNQTFPTFNVYVGGPIVNKSPISIGLGVYTPFGSGLKWDDNWAGQFIIRQIKLSTVFFQPTVSWRLNDMLSIGGGFIYAVGGMNLRKGIPLQDMSGQNGEAELKGDAHGVGFNIGIHLKASEKFMVGFTYHSQVNMKVKRGYASFSVPASMESSFPYTAFSTTLPLPQIGTLGIGYKASERVTLQADVSYTGWSAYQSLDFNYEKNTSALLDSKNARQYKNTMSIRAGGHVKVSEKICLMVGGGWDPSPVRDGYVSPELPDADRAVFSGGFTIKPLKRLTILGAVEYAKTVKRSGSLEAENFKGKYQTTAFVPGLGVTLDF